MDRDGEYMDEQIKKNTFYDLPWRHIAFATDFSEVFSLDPLHELQSLYYSKDTVKILVFVVVRHAQMELDGEQSSAEHFVPVYENWYVLTRAFGARARRCARAPTLSRADAR